MTNVYRDFDQKNEAMKAKFQNLVYSFSPTLIEFVPVELVDAWLKFVVLSPRRLLPALARYRIQFNPPENKTNQAIRYLEFCVNDLRTQDKAVHNYLISLYVLERDENRLIQYLQKPNRRFDLQYALRQCMIAKKTRARVFIYGQMGLYEEAVELSLSFDVDLAIKNAESVCS